ncbi:MAG: DNA mismatch repair endonuclease MutL [Thermoguttaceae bacterium]
MPPIHQLSQSLINKIAAGEVIERPASVVKELMENAIDGGAKRIDVTVTGGGGEMIRVVDDGCGIAADELPLAVASHATSKLLEADDLFRVGTLGFRGEALASIAEVSRTVIRSRTPEGQSGAEIEVAGGRPGETMPCGCPVGTAVEVHNLFFNTPVRRKFLRRPPTEFGHISEAFTRIALGSPQVHFTLKHNERIVFELATSEAWVERIARFFGRDLADGLIYVESSGGPGESVHLAGYAAKPTHSRGNNRMQYLFLNGRYIRDRALQHALGEAYRGMLTSGRFPIAFLTLDMPPELVDVNVHPTKLEVRFQDSGQLYSQLLSTLRSKFLTTDMATYVQSADGNQPGMEEDRAKQSAMRQELVDWAKKEVSSWSESARDENSPREREPLELRRLDQPWPTSADGPRQVYGQADNAVPGHNPESRQIAHGAEPRAVQIHNRYLVTEAEDGVMVVDQHALHERILYEQLRKRIAEGPVETQNLLVPEPVDLSAAEAATILDHRELLERLGMKIEPFGGDTVLISGYPAMLANINPAEVLRELLDRLLSGGKQPNREDLLDELLHTIACKAAVKAGDRLSPEEITALLDQRHLVDDPHHCPHGRPTALIFSREELDRQFKRV